MISSLNLKEIAENKRILIVDVVNWEEIYKEYRPSLRNIVDPKDNTAQFLGDWCATNKMIHFNIDQPQVGLKKVIRFSFGREEDYTAFKLRWV